MTRSFVREIIRNFIVSERAQAMTEYILMLSIALMLFLIVVRGFVQPWVKKLAKILEDRISKDFFKGGDAMHRLPFR